eukprot:5262649-Pyramimonas_sp.AAC.1
MRSSRAPARQKTGEMGPQLKSSETAMVAAIGPRTTFQRYRAEPNLDLIRFHTLLIIILWEWSKCLQAPATLNNCSRRSLNWGSSSAEPRSSKTEVAQAPEDHLPEH